MIKIHTKSKIPLIIAAVFLLLFMIVAMLTSGTQGFLLDENVAYWADQNNSAFMSTITKYASFIGSSEIILVLTVIIGLVLLIKRNWRNFFFFFTLSVGGVILNLALKMIVRRARPGDEVSYIEVFNMNLEIQSYSFPSGHTMRATILILFLMYISFVFIKRGLVKFLSYLIWIGLIVAVALSRVMLDAHFVTDVAGAILISISWFFLCTYFFHRRKRASYPMYIHR